MDAKNVFFVGGAWVSAEGREPLAVVDPSTEQQVSSVPAGTADDVDAAVQAARAAFEGWASLTPGERAAYLTATADALEARTDEVALLISTEMGTPLAFSKAVQVGNPVRVLRSYATILADYAFEERIANSLVVKEPIGVVGAITPWNYPLHQIAAKVAPALAAGCTVVVKPSELVPGVAYLLAEVIDSVGLPAGVFNLVPGTGPVVGEAIVSHELVDMVSFTGSTRAGRRVAELAAAAPKRTSLELGGKSASVLLDDLSADELGNAI
ncbi:MAG: aldehyde dehydrogenase family protein, partial [Frankiales bacterium]|nr:aldehyde dehydrogenase family protein [Frankiales bacterium]